MATAVSELAPGIRTSPMYQSAYPMGMSPPRPGEPPTKIKYEGPSWSVSKSSHLLQAFIVFLIVTAIVWLILFFLKPSAFMKTGPDGKPTGQLDMARVFFASIIIGLFVAVIYWLVKWCR